MKIHIRSLAVASFVLFFSSPVFAEDDSKIKALIENLGSEQFNERQTSFDELAKKPNDAAPLIINAYLSNDAAEVRSRCLSLLKKWSESNDEVFIDKLTRLVNSVEKSGKQVEIARLRELLLLEVPKIESVVIDKLRSLGCEIVVADNNLRLDMENWQGSPRQLRYLQGLKRPININVNELNMKWLLPALENTSVAQLGIQKKPTEFRRGLPPIRAVVKADDIRMLPNCKKLASLSFSQMDVEPECFEIIGKCVGLTHLELPDSTTDDVLKHLTGLEKLKSISFHNAFKVRGPGIVHLGGLKNLERVEIFYTNVSTNALKHLAKLPKIRDLYLPQTSMYDEGMKYVAQMTNLERLKLDNTHVTNHGLKQIMHLKKLDYLYLGSGSFSDAGLIQLAKMPALRDVHTGGSIITEQGKKALAKANPNINVRGDFYKPNSDAEYTVIEELLSGGMRIEQYPRTNNFTLTFEESQWHRPVEEIEKVQKLTNPKLILVGPMSQPAIASVMKLPATTHLMLMNGRTEMAKFHKEHVEQLKTRFKTVSDLTNR